MRAVMGVAARVGIVTRGGISAHLGIVAGVGAKSDDHGSGDEEVYVYANSLQHALIQPFHVITSDLQLAMQQSFYLSAHVKFLAVLPSGGTV